MNNYAYIISDFPVLVKEAAGNDRLDADALISGIRDSIDQKDAKTLDTLLDGFDTEKLCKEFYVKALSNRSRFIREFFKFDLCLRNEKAEYLNKELGRAHDTDLILLESLENECFDRKDEIQAALQTKDILGREKSLDNLVWDAIDDIIALDILDFDIILGFIAKLKIVDRWLKLDAERGRELFKKMIEQIRMVFDNKNDKLI